MSSAGSRGKRATYMEGKYRSERDRADHEAILGDAEARREVKRLEKAQAEVEKHRAQLEHRMRQA